MDIIISVPSETLHFKREIVRKACATDRFSVYLFLATRVRRGEPSERHTQIYAPLDRSVNQCSQATFFASVTTSLRDFVIVALQPEGSYTVNSAARGQRDV